MCVCVCVGECVCVCVCVSMCVTPADCFCISLRIRLYCSPCLSAWIRCCLDLSSRLSLSVVCLFRSFDISVYGCSYLFTSIGRHVSLVQLLYVCPPISLSLSVSLAERVCACVCVCLPVCL